MQLEEDLKINVDQFLLSNSSGLEAILGRAGSEFEQLLEGSGEYQL